MTLSESIRKDRTSLQERKDLKRAEIASHVDAFLADGMSITEVPNGMSAANPDGHFVTMQEFWSKAKVEELEIRNGR